MERPEPSIHISAACAARPETVYDLLADLPSHLTWAGSEQSRSYRLVALHAPDGPARPGTTFTSRGMLPMSSRRWQDRSTVTVAERPGTLEFITEGRVDGRRPMTARWRNRYEITPTEDGCRVTHSLALVQVTNPMLRLRVPVLRYLAFKVGIPMASGRGLRNLVAMAEAREAVDSSAVGRLAS